MPLLCSIYGWRGRIRYYLLTTDPTTLPKDGTWYLMTNLESKIEKTIGKAVSQKHEEAHKGRNFAILLGIVNLFVGVEIIAEL